MKALYENDFLKQLLIIQITKLVILTFSQLKLRHFYLLSTKNTLLIPDLELLFSTAVIFLNHQLVRQIKNVNNNNLKIQTIFNIYILTAASDIYGATEDFVRNDVHRYNTGNPAFIRQNVWRCNKYYNSFIPQSINIICNILPKKIKNILFKSLKIPIPIIYEIA